MSSGNGRPILIAYDGSDNAKHAIRVAAALLGGGEAHVVHAWETLSSASSRLAVYAFTFGGGAAELEYERDQAEAKAEEGAAFAREAGFDATGTAVKGMGPIWATLSEYVNEERPPLVVMGTRGLSGFRGALHGSVSHGVTVHAHVPVLVIPPE